jgi:uncharacterized protein
MRIKQALIFFLVFTFGLTLLLIFFARQLGFTLFGAPAIMSQLTILAAMFVPAIGAIISQKAYLKRPLKELGFRWGPWSMYFKTYAVIIFIFAVNYTITWKFFLKPDWTLNSFINQFSAYNPSLVLPMTASEMIAIFAAITFLAAPIFNMIPSLGEEIGWRGFLLPALEPLGKIKAMVISGMIWALWHTPMIIFLGFAYGIEFWPGALLHFVLVTGFGIWMGYVWFKTRSTIQTAFMHSVFNANAYGIWTMLFVTKSKLVVGAAGTIGTVLVLILSVITIQLYLLKESDNKLRLLH